MMLILQEAVLSLIYMFVKIILSYKLIRQAIQISTVAYHQHGIFQYKYQPNDKLSKFRQHSNYKIYSFIVQITFREFAHSDLTV